MCFCGPEAPRSQRGPGGRSAVRDYSYRSLLRHPLRQGYEEQRLRRAGWRVALSWRRSPWGALSDADTCELREVRGASAGQRLRGPSGAGGEAGIGGPFVPVWRPALPGGSRVWLGGDELDDLGSAVAVVEAEFHGQEFFDHGDVRWHVGVGRHGDDAAIAGEGHG